MAQRLTHKRSPKLQTKPQPARRAADFFVFKQTPPAALRKGDVRKLQIVEAAVQCLAELGWAGTNYETVGNTCGMKRPHVAYHFPVWEDLVFAAIQYVYATGQGIVAEHLRDVSGDPGRVSAGDRLKKYVEGTFAWLEQNPTHSSVITLLWHLATISRKYATLATEVKRTGAERLLHLLYTTERDRQKSRNREATLAIHALIVGHCVERMSTDFGKRGKDLVAQVVASAEALR